MSTIDQTLTFLSGHAQSALADANDVTNRMAFLTDLPTRSAGFAFTPNKPNVSKPESFGDILPGDTSEASIQYLDAKMDAWLAKFFPELADCLKSTPEEWLCGIITGSAPFGLSREVFETVWHQGRDRAYRTAASETATLRAEFSARGFSLPPGALIGAINAAEVRAGEAVAEVNRTQTVKDAEIKLDLLKFAEEQAIRLKLGIMQALGDFYRQWISLPGRDADIARAKTAAYASLNSALSDYYRVELGFEELRLRAAEANAGFNLRENDKNAHLVDAYNGRNTSLAQAAQAFGEISAGAANAAGSLQAEVSTGAL